MLEAIGSQGSISAAAKQQGISYRSAWDAVNEMNNLWDSPLVEKSPGGAHGGGTRLTQQGKELIASFHLMQQEYERFTHSISRNLGEFERLQNSIRRFSMRSSARNQFQGSVEIISKGQVNTEVEIELEGGKTLIAIITAESARELELDFGKPICTLIKASHVILGVN